MGVLDGKAAVITGAAGVLGSAYARAMAKAGARLLLNDIDAAKLDPLAAELRAAGCEVATNSDDVSSWAAGKRIVDACMDAFRRIDCLVNNGHMFRKGDMTGKATIWELQEAQLELAILDIRGHFACTHHAVQHMRRQRSGSVINTTSRAIHGHPTHSSYNAVKTGVIGATWTWAMELAEDRIRVNCISPIAHKNPATQPVMHLQWNDDYSLKSSSLAHPNPPAENAAPLVVYLASDLSDWLSGQVILLGGDTLALLTQLDYRFAFKPDGWSVDDLKDHMRATLGASLATPGQSGKPYPWYDGVR